MIKDAQRDLYSLQKYKYILYRYIPNQKKF